MKNDYMIIGLTYEEVKSNPFMTKEGKAPFYRLVCEKIGLDYDDIKCLDCTKINIARNIQDAWYDYANESDINNRDLTMCLLMSGPKTSAELKDNCVELEEGVIEW